MKMNCMKNSFLKILTMKVAQITVNDRSFKIQTETWRKGIIAIGEYNIQLHLPDPRTDGSTPKGLRL